MKKLGSYINTLLTWSIALTLTMSTLFASPADSRDSGKMKSGWLLKQIASGSGELDFIVTDDAIKGESKMLHLIFVAKAPDWKICCWNLESKQMGYVTLAKWRDFNSSTLGTTDECTLEKPISVRPLTERPMPIKAFVYTFPGETSNSLPMRTQAPTSFSSFSVECCNLSKAPQTAKIQCELYNFAPMQGCVTSVIGKIKNSNRLGWKIKTISLKPSSTISPDEFVPPSGYLQLKTLNNTFKYKSISKPLDDMSDMLNMGGSSVKP